MSNQATITRTIFQSVDETGKVVGTSYGLRIFDDEAAFYSNYVGSLEALNAMTPEDLVEAAREIGEGANAILDFAEENDTGVIIDDEEFKLNGGSIAP